MLAIRDTNKPLPVGKVIPNVLPCSIKHDGPFPFSDRHWHPQPDDATDSNSSSTAYFRGRKLRSKTVKLPDNYEGVTLQKTDKILPAQTLPPLPEDDLADMEEDEEDRAEVKIAERTGQFDRVVVWGHEFVPDADDVFIKGVHEWIKFAEAMHSYEQPNGRS